MLGTNHVTKFQELIESYPLNVLVPPHVQRDLSIGGVSSSFEHDTRVAARFRCNGQAIISWVDSPIALKRQMPTSKVIVRNLSKSGIAVLTDRQWFPEQVCRIQTSIAELTAKVARARQIGPRCFEIGLKLLSYKPYKK